MGLGSFLFRNAIRQAARSARISSKHRHCHNPVEDIVTAAATAAAVSFGTKIIDEIFSKSGESPNQTEVKQETKKETKRESNKFADGILAKLAALCYIAGIDGSVTPEERAELDMAASDLLCAYGISESYKNQARALLEDRNVTFAKVQPYLDRVDGNVLVSHLLDLKSLAETSNGITDSEATAIEVYKKYVTSRTGCTFEDEDDTPQEVNLTCPGCSATMLLDETYLKATCPYCGTTKIIDAKQISKVLGKKIK